MDDLNSQDRTPPEQIEVAPGTLALLGDVVFGAPLVPAILDAYLRDRGHPPDRKWKLKLLGAVIVADAAEQEEPPRLGAADG